MIEALFKEGFGKKLIWGRSSRKSQVGTVKYADHDFEQRAKI